MNYDQPAEKGNDLLEQMALWEKNQNKIMGGQEGKTAFIDFLKNLSVENANRFQLEVINFNGVGIGALNYVEDAKAKDAGGLIELTKKMFDAEEDEERRELARQIAENL